MAIISDEKIQEIRNSADIVSIISDYVPLKMQGKNYFGICPFHDDHTPSMSVSKERQLFKCFVCNKGGNVFTFVKDYENISFQEAVKRVADKVGIPFQYTINDKVDNKFKLEYEIMDFTTMLYQNNLNSKEGEEARNYLKKRHLSDDTIKEFKIGYSLDDSKYLYNVLMKKKYDIDKLDELGLINKDGLSGYDRFVNRIMIPITNLEGKIVGFTGRIFHDEDTAKYINTKETSIYKKGNIIFNYYNAKNYIRDEKVALLVEGNMDAIRISTSGIKNVLALMGTALTKEQIAILKKLRVPIILMLDNDNAGEIATLNIGDALSKNDVACSVVRLEGAKDPDEYIVKYGVEAFKDTIKHAINFLDYRLMVLKKNKNLNNTEELVTYVKEVMDIIKDKDNLTKEITLKKLSNDFHLDYDILKKEVSFTPEIKKEETSNLIKRETPKKQDRYTLCVQNILYYMMSDEKYLKIYNKKLGFLKEEKERNLVTEIEYYLQKYGTINFADFLTYAEKYDNIRNLVNNISDNVNIIDLSDNEFMGYLKIADDIMKKDNIRKIKEKIAKSTDVNEQMDDINKQIELKKRIINKEEV